MSTLRYWLALRICDLGNWLVLKSIWVMAPPQRRECQQRLAEFEAALKE